MEQSEFACNLCGFSSRWLNGLTFHKSSAHQVKRKLKCEKEVFTATQHYWRSGILQPNIQVYINALLDVEEAMVDDCVKEVEERKLELLWKEASSPT